MKMPKLSTKQWILAGIILLLLIGVGAFLYFKNQEETGSNVAQAHPYEGKFLKTSNGSIYEMKNGVLHGISHPSIMDARMMELYGTTNWQYQDISDAEFATLKVA